MGLEDRKSRFYIDPGKFHRSWSNLKPKHRSLRNCPIRVSNPKSHTGSIWLVSVPNCCVLMVFDVFEDIFHLKDEATVAFRILRLL